MDTYFDRRWKSKAEQPPLTLLGAVSRRAAPFAFSAARPSSTRRRPPKAAATRRRGGRRRPLHQVLGPGEEMETFVCTDGDDKAAADAVENYHGKLLWRVHLRRGIVTAGRAPFGAGFLGDRRRIHRRRLSQKQLIPALLSP